MWPNVCKTLSFSSYFHLSYSLSSQILCYTNSLFSKNYIVYIVPGKFDDNRPISTSVLCFFQVDRTYLCHWLIIFLSFLFQITLSVVVIPSSMVILLLDPQVWCNSDVSFSAMDCILYRTLPLTPIWVCVRGWGGGGGWVVE